MPENKSDTREFLLIRGDIPVCVCVCARAGEGEGKKKNTEKNPGVTVS